MSRYLVDRLEAEPSITVRVRSRITRAVGDGRLERLVIAGETAGEEVELPADALFIMIGGIPVSERVEGWLRRDENGIMVTGADVLAGGDRDRWWPLERDPYPLEASQPGVFIAGDAVMGRSSGLHRRSAKPRAQSSSCTATLQHCPSSKSVGEGGSSPTIVAGLRDRVTRLAGSVCQVSVTPSMATTLAVDERRRT
jgi:thioredoxin reductase